MSSFFSWFKAHASAILGTALVVAKGGLLGKAGVAIVSALAALVGVNAS